MLYCPELGSRAARKSDAALPEDVAVIAYCTYVVRDLVARVLTALVVRPDLG
jgi:hypothetical protein